MTTFHKNLRKIAEIIRNFLAKILKIYPKKMYTLIRYAGEAWWEVLEQKMASYIARKDPLLGDMRAKGLHATRTLQKRCLTAARVETSNMKAIQNSFKLLKRRTLPKFRNI